jgi:putative Mn2+ efflux pump MntP
MRVMLSLILVFAGSAAAAHPGHWADLAGHDHWVAGAAIGLAGLAAIWGALKGKKAKEEEPEEELEEEAA